MQIDDALLELQPAILPTIKRPRLFEGGHGSAGVNSASRSWFLAEGATGPFFDCFVLMSNPNNVAANVSLLYLLPDGTTIPQQIGVPANGRTTINVETSRLSS